jgi:hypothetical protein
LGVPLTHHSISNLCKRFYSIIFKTTKNVVLKISIGCGVFGSGCYGLRLRFGNPRLIIIANDVKQSQKELTLPNKRLLRASPFAMMLSNEGEAVPAVRFAHRRPPHPSREF